MRRWMGGRKSFNGLGDISADPLTSFLAPYSLSRWEREVVVAMMELDCLPISLTVLWFVDTVLEAGKDVLEEDWR
jgi:hypothetical protein